MRGFLSGWIWGLVAVGAGIAALSLLVPLGRVPELAEHAPVAGAAAPEGGPQPVARALGADPEPARAELPGLPTTADRAAPAAVETAPASRPEIAGAGGQIAAFPPTPSEVTAPTALDAAAPRPAPGTMPASAPDTPLVRVPTGPAVSPVPQQIAAPAGAADAAAMPRIGNDAIALGGPARLEPVAGGENLPGAQIAATRPLADAPAPLPRLAALPQAGAEAVRRPGIGTPVVPLTERAARVGADVALDAAPPLRRHAAVFEPPEGRPLLAVVLIDTGDAAALAALDGLGVPASVALDPMAEGAAQRMAAHRAAGREVLALVDLPRVAAARDAEVLLAAGFDALPETVALLEGTGAGIQGNRALSDQVADVLRAAGRGLVTRANGLNSLQKRAARSGVAAAVIHRDLDGAGEGTAAILRSLDQAALRAGQEGAVVLMGRLRPETLEALALWSAQDRPGRAILAPVSAALMPGE
ncbi:MAG: divergent polysaccharide deacetylase family protein [Sedimentitalea sp.]|nr:divergent polysaccharide deacetylase family protein [Sedimentitalea sp.]